MGVPGPHPHAKYHHCGFKNVSLGPPKSPKLEIFSINVPLLENTGVHGKTLVYSAQLQTVVYAMAP